MALARNAIQRDAERVDRVVSIVAFPSAGQLFLPRIAACFASADGPHVALADHDAAPEQTVALCGDYDVVIAHRWRIHRTWPAGHVHVTPLLDEPYDVALPAAHPLAQRPHLRPQDLLSVEWIAGQAGWAPAGIITAIGAVAGEEPQVRHRINDLAPRSRWCATSVGSPSCRASSVTTSSATESSPARSTGSTPSVRWPP